MPLYIIHYREKSVDGKRGKIEINASNVKKARIIFESKHKDSVINVIYRLI